MEELRQTVLDDEGLDEARRSQLLKIITRRVGVVESRIGKQRMGCYHESNVTNYLVRKKRHEMDLRRARVLGFD